MIDDRLEERLKVALVVHKLANGKVTLSSGTVLIRTHEPTIECFRRGCSIHNPTDPHPEWPQNWHAGVMERQCPCGTWHVDKDDFNYRYDLYLRLSSSDSGNIDHTPDYWPLRPDECQCDCNCCRGASPE